MGRFLQKIITQLESIRSDIRSPQLVTLADTMLYRRPVTIDERRNVFRYRKLVFLKYDDQSILLFIKTKPYSPMMTLTFTECAELDFLSQSKKDRELDTYTCLTLPKVPRLVFYFDPAHLS